MKREKYMKVYQAWADMRYRCNNPNAKSYDAYGGRGIGYSKEWEDYNIFREDMLDGYLDMINQDIPPRKITLGRIDTNADYSKVNCRWMTPQESPINSYKTRDNYLVSFKGGIKRVFPSVTELAKFYGYPRTSVSNALRKGNYYTNEITFRAISKEDYERALIDENFLNNLDVPTELPNKKKTVGELKEI